MQCYPDFHNNLAKILPYPLLGQNRNGTSASGEHELTAEFIYLYDMTPTELAAKVVDRMMSQDWFSQWLGIKVLDIKPGSCKLQLTVTKEMLNGFAIAHGGISYSLSDSALAFASNSHGRMAVSVETSISHLATVKEGDVLTSTAIEKNLSNKIGVYEVVTLNQREQIVALFKGTVYRKSEQWFPA